MKETDQVVQEFHSLVNMSPSELQAWLQTDESLNVGMTRENEDEAVGHQSGRKIIEILERQDQYTDQDISHMRKVVSYIKRHLAQRHRIKSGNVEHTRWAYSLKNWGHDPVKVEE
ncbi:DNA-binding protein [Spizellomyces punctatus DAOM BR117]|uniref:DNA-binding protein n=1 Tax=Spizellomyces punctatus (strain DAOM BR117) TaxID=645134 RepID=A0A0L0HC27_SPIPD|nr:DNA-binding protein [Spizellomyces punctatus DAOM BR117]KNC99085.1 DNA-binding protein [Spizellomyces punctatus DAOM BR117]|eukprot:XP_016607125.1 DNA-binding protein [Spizellomyces punctatus DAOM BR117]